MQFTRHAVSALSLSITELSRDRTGFFFSGYTQTAGFQQTLIRMDQYATILNKSDEVSLPSQRSFNDTSMYTAEHMPKQKLLIRLTTGTSRTEREGLLDSLRYP